MTPPTAANSFSALFAAYFGQLVLLLRRQPGDTAAQKYALRGAMAVLPRGPFRIEAGIEHSEVPDDSSLKGRLLSRHVDAIDFASNAGAAEVLALARSLAADQGPVPSTAGVGVELLPASAVRADLTAGELASRPDPANSTPSFTRHRTMAGPVGEAEQLAELLDQSAATGHWMEAIHAAQALVRLTLRFPEHEQRGHLISLRRILPRQLLEQFISYAIRVTEEQARVSEILQHAGPEGIETMVDQIGRAEAVGPWKFVHDTLAAMPTAQPMLLALLASPKWHQVRHGVELLGKLGQAESIEPLRGALSHPDERVRKAVVEALARFPHHSVIEPIRQSLSDPAPGPRISAAQALSQRNSRGLALPIVVALETEKDPAAWDALVGSLARIDSAEAMNALVEIAVDRRPLLQTGRPLTQRLAVVNALRTAGTEAARRALDRLALEGDSPVRRAAAAAIEGITRSQ